MSIRFGLLGLLSRTSTHGYELRSEFEAMTGDAWPLNVGQVYTTLQRLERDGLVAGVDDGADAGSRDRRRYQVTDQGSDQLRAWFGTPVPREAPPRSELVIKLALALELPDIDPQAVIDVQRDATMRSLQGLIQAKEALVGNRTASLVADAAIFNAEAEIRWLDHCEAALRSPAGKAHLTRKATS